MDIAYKHALESAKKHREEAAVLKEQIALMTQQNANSNSTPDPTQTEELKRLKERVKKLKDMELELGYYKDEKRRMEVEVQFNAQELSKVKEANEELVSKVRRLSKQIEPLEIEAIMENHESPLEEEVNKLKSALSLKEQEKNELREKLEDVQKRLSNVQSTQVNRLLAYTSSTPTISPNSDNGSAIPPPPSTTNNQNENENENQYNHNNNNNNSNSNNINMNGISTMQQPHHQYATPYGRAPINTDQKMEEFEDDDDDDDSGGSMSPLGGGHSSAPFGSMPVQQKRPGDQPSLAEMIQAIPTPNTAGITGVNDNITELKFKLANAELANQQLKRRVSIAGVEKQELSILWEHPRVTIQMVSEFIERLPVKHKEKIWARHCTGNYIAKNKILHTLHSFVALCIKIKDRTAVAPSRQGIEKKLIPFADVIRTRTANANGMSLEEFNAELHLWILEPVSGLIMTDGEQQKWLDEIDSLREELVKAQKEKLRIQRKSQIDLTKLLDKMKNMEDAPEQKVASLQEQVEDLQGIA